MIVIQCTQCKRQLSIDDAFAGGVCRCQHCGTIQTVPTAAQAAATTADAPARSLYQHTGRSAGSGTGLDDLAGMVQSSGLASGRLTKNGPAKPLGLLPLWIGLGAAVAVAAVVAVLMLRPSDPAAPASTARPGTPPADPQVAADPNFCGILLHGKTVVYLLDCGAGTKDHFGELKDAVGRSLSTLRPDQKFEVLFWYDKGTRDFDFPQSSTTYATPENVVAAREAMAKSYPVQGTDVDAGLEIALAQHPDEVVIATGKGDNLDDEWTAHVLAQRGDQPVKFDAINIGPPQAGKALRDLATKTRGNYMDVGRTDLVPGQ